MDQCGPQPSPSPLSPPVDLGPVPKIVSRDDVARALEALHWLNSWADQIEGAFNRAAAELKTRSDKQLELVVAGQATTVDRYAKALEDELHRWGLENPGEFESEKTLHFSHGALGYRVGPMAIATIGDSKTLTEKVMLKLRAGFETLLKKAGLLGYWRVKIEPELGEMGKAIKSGTLKPADLKSHGFKVVPGKERIEITVGVNTSAKQ